MKILNKFKPILRKRFAMTNKTILMTMTIVSLFTVGITLGGIPNVYAPCCIPVADANGPYSAVLGNSITYDGTGSFDPDGDALTFVWDFGDGNIGTGPTPTHTHALFGTYTICLTVTDEGGSTDTDCTTAIIKNIIAVDIDIKPNSDPNSINTRSMGVVPVAILGSDTLDVTDVDVSTLMFGNASPAHDLSDSDTYNEHIQDVNGDGFLDLVSHYKQKDTGIACGDTDATLTGTLLDGTLIEGTDSVNPKGC